MKRILSLLKSIRNLTEVKETEKSMDTDMREFGKRSFSIKQKIEKLIYVTVDKTAGSHLKGSYFKKSKFHSLFNSHSFKAFVRGLLFSEKMLEDPAYFTRCH